MIHEHRHMAKAAADVDDSVVQPDDLEALRWVREKRGIIDFGRPYVHQTAQGLRVNNPARPVEVEIPFFGFEPRFPDPLPAPRVLVAKSINEIEISARPIEFADVESFAVAVGHPTYERRRLAASAPTLRAAVDKLKMILEKSLPEETYPGRDAGFDRVLANVGSAEVRVADLVALIRDYLDAHGSSGGTLHCALADGNMDDRMIDWEIEHAREAGDKAALLIAELLRLMPADERKRLDERGYDR